MSEIQQAVQSAKGLAKQFRSVLTVVEALEDIGDLEQTFDEITLKVRQINEIHTKVVDQRLTAEGLLAETLDKLKQAHAHLDEARVEAERFVSEAVILGKDIVYKAKKAADAVAEVSENRKRNAQRAHEIAMEQFSVLEQAAIGRLEIINTELAELRKRIGSK